MKRQLFALMAMMLIGCTTTVWGQTDLSGRTYYNPNIMADKLNEATKDINKEELRQKGIAKAEKKKGRKLTAAEKAKIDKELEKTIKTIEAMKKGVTTAITVEFKDKKNMVLKADIKVSDEAMKAAGIGWLKRKAMKAALAIAPSSEKGTYVVKGQQVIMTDSNGEKDTLLLSQDCQYLSGKMDKDTPFKLKRKK
jgi:hypothetical protein